MPFFGGDGNVGHNLPFNVVASVRCEAISRLAGKSHREDSQFKRRLLCRLGLDMSEKNTRSTRPAAPRNDIVELMCSFLTILLVCGRVHYLASRAAFHFDHPAFAKWIAVECFGLVRKSFFC